jgi:hypothetical protein
MAVEAEAFRDMLVPETSVGMWRRLAFLTVLSFCIFRLCHVIIHDTKEAFRSRIKDHQESTRVGNKPHLIAF